MLMALTSNVWAVDGIPFSSGEMLTGAGLAQHHPVARGEDVLDLPMAVDRSLARRHDGGPERSRRRPEPGDRAARGLRGNNPTASSFFRPSFISRRSGARRP